MKNIRIQLSSLVGRWVFQILFLFNKVVIHGEKKLLDLAEQGNPVMVCVWHGRLIFPSWYIRLKITNLYAIASHHDDAEIMARILNKWGYGLIRGSTKKGGKAVILKMAEVFQDGGIIAVTNDGPKGPAQVAKAGSANLAIKHKVKIITITGSATKYWQINSWDKFLLPKPFGRIEIIISPPLEIGSKSISTEEEVNILSNFMTDYQNRVDIKTGKIKE